MLIWFCFFNKRRAAEEVCCSKSHELIWFLTCLMYNARLNWNVKKLCTDNFFYICIYVSYTPVNTFSRVQEPNACQLQAHKTHLVFKHASFISTVSTHITYLLIFSSFSSLHFWMKSGCKKAGVCYVSYYTFCTLKNGLKKALWVFNFI